MIFDFEFAVKTFWLCIKAIPVTLEITFVALILAAIPAYAFAFCRIKKTPVFSRLCGIYISFMRGTPILLQILVVYSLLPSLLNVFCKKHFPGVNIFDLNPIIYAFIVFTLNTIATLSEVFRSALLSVENGQYEAGLCCGLSGFQTYRCVILPQALSGAIPNLCNLTVILIKNSSLAFMMTVKDITAVAKIQASYGFNYIEAYADIFVIYIILCTFVQSVFAIIERRFAKKIR